MELYISNIPKGARPAELKKLAKEQLRGRLFERMYERLTRLGRFDDELDIEIFKSASGRKGHRYGLVTTQSANFARIIAEALDGANLRGKQLCAREYVKRRAMQDRRHPGWRLRHWPEANRRTSERRQTRLA